MASSLVPNAFLQLFYEHRFNGRMFGRFIRWNFKFLSLFFRKKEVSTWFKVMPLISSIAAPACGFLRKVWSKCKIDFFLIQVSRFYCLWQYSYSSWLKPCQPHRMLFHWSVSTGTTGTTDVRTNIASMNRQQTNVVYNDTSFLTGRKRRWRMNDIECPP